MPTPRRPRFSKQSSSSSQQSGNRNIREFFKPFTIPKNRIPANDVVEEEIVVASPRKESALNGSGSGSGRERGSTSPLSSPVKSQRSVAIRKASTGLTTPTKSRRSSPVKRKLARQLDGAGDEEDDLPYESSQSSQQRVMAAVEIPTPRRRPSPQPAPATTGRGTNTTASTTANTTAVSASFNSISSLAGSQASSSRRIVKDGIPLVTNSDSGSAEDSEDELLDIVIPRKKMRMTPPPAATEDETNAPEVPSTIKPPARHSGRVSAGKKSHDSSRSLTPRGRLSHSPPRPANMGSLLKLVREKEKREKADAKIRETETAFETGQKLREAKAQRERDLGGGLKALVADDSDEGERMMLAVERTEAMGGQEEEWFYFRGVREDVEVREPRASDVAAFAPWAEPKFTRLKGLVMDAGQREQACLSGFMAEVVGTYGLPPELMDWMFQRLVREPREEMCEAYVEVFRRYLGRHEGNDRVLDEDWGYLSRTYRTADVSSGLDMASSRDRKSQQLDGSPPGLRHVVRVVRYACANAPDGIPAKNFLELALASVDTHIGKNAELKGQLQESMAAIVESITPAAIHGLAHTLSSETSTMSLSLRCRIILSLRAHSKRCHKLRRLLALYLVANKQVPAPSDDEQETLLNPSAAEWCTILLARLRSAPEWNISESTNYTHLNALIPILDIALDAGFPTTPSTTTTASPAKQERPNPLLSKIPQQSAEERSFNAQIDQLTDTLRALGARIRDAGTSHLRRTEAKSALERVVVRLEYCVRTRPRPRKGVFGGGGGERQMGLMNGFLKLKESGGHVENGAMRPRGRAVGMGMENEDRVSVVAEEMLSDRGGDSEAEAGAEDDDNDGDEDGDEF